jgi:hypothetical protein
MNLWVEFTERCAWKIFDGSFPENASPELIAVAILEACPLIAGASLDVRKNFLSNLVPLIYFRKIAQQHAADAANGTEWRA